MNFNDYVKPELVILIPVLYLIGMAIKKSKIKDSAIPFILGGIAILLSGVWVFANVSVSGTQEILTALFTAFTQGVLVAGASVYVNQLIKQSKED